MRSTLRAQRVCALPHHHSGSDSISGKATLYPPRSQDGHRNRNAAKLVLDRFVSICAAVGVGLIMIVLAYALERQQACGNSFAMVLDDLDICQLLPVRGDSYEQGVPSTISPPVYLLTSVPDPSRHTRSPMVTRQAHVPLARPEPDRLLRPLH